MPTNHPGQSFKEKHKNSGQARAGSVTKMASSANTGVCVGRSQIQVFRG